MSISFFDSPGGSKQAAASGRFDSIRFDSQCVLERLSFLSGNKQQSNNTILVLLQLLASESVTSSQKHDHHVFNL
jgi:hypothetical protein